MIKRKPGLSRQAANMKATTGGYKCACGHRTATMDGRPTEHGFRRRRECPACGNRFTTYEVQIQGGDDFLFLARRISNDGFAVVEAANHLSETLKVFRDAAALHQKVIDTKRDVRKLEAAE